MEIFNRYDCELELERTSNTKPYTLTITHRPTKESVSGQGWILSNLKERLFKELDKQLKEA